MAVKSKVKSSKQAAPTTAPKERKRRRDAPAVRAPVAASPVQAEDDVFHVSAKKQRLEQVSAIAKDVMIKLLTGDLSYDVTDAEWDHLVQLTQSHSAFDKHFDFPSTTDSGWVTPKKKKKATHLKIVALDCEMCVTAPLKNTVDRKSNALCRVSAVNGEDMIQGIISDLIVHQPEAGYRMVDAKTDIHGVTMAMIDQSKISVSKAQKHLLKYINADTIIVGHSVHGDLASLRINHKRVIDTAKIFQRKDGDEARSTPGLKCLTKFLLKFEMPDGHDSTIDAQASMLAAKYAVKKGCGRIIPSMLELHGPRIDSRRGPAVPTYTGPPKILPTSFQLNLIGTDPVPEAPEADLPAEVGSTRVPMNRPPSVEVLEARSCQLRVHHIPRGLTALDLEQFFMQSTKIVPAAIAKVVWPEKKPHGSANVTFTTNMHAHLAFETVAHDKTETDAIGRPQKIVSLTTAKGKKYKGIKIGIM